MPLLRDRRIDVVNNRPIGRRIAARRVVEHRGRLVDNAQGVQNDLRILTNFLIVSLNIEGKIHEVVTLRAPNELRGID